MAPNQRKPYLCPYCGGTYRRGDEVCPECGGDVHDPKWVRALAWIGGALAWVVVAAIVVLSAGPYLLVGALIVLVGGPILAWDWLMDHAPWNRGR